MVLLNSKPKSEYVLPPGLLCSTMGLTVVPSNVQKPRYSKATGENSTSQFNVRTGEDIPTILSPNTYSTWKPPVDLPFQNEGQNDLAEIPEMDEYPVTVPFTHPTPYADGLRTYRPVPDHSACLVNNLHAGRWEARAFCRQMDMSHLNTHEGRWEKRHMRNQLPNVVPWMHENRWQKRTGAWTRKVPDGDAGGTHSFGAGQGCRKDSVPEGFRLPLYNGPESPEPSANRAFRPPTWGRAGDTSVPMGPTESLPKQEDAPAGSRPATHHSAKRGWGGTTILAASHPPFLRPSTVPLGIDRTAGVTGSSPSTKGLGIPRKAATLHRVCNGVGEVSPTLVRAGKARHPIMATDVTRWDLMNPMSLQLHPHADLPPDQNPWFGMKKNDIHFEKKGTTMPEVLGQIPPDEKVLESIREKLGANSKIRDSTNPHDDPNLVGRLYTYRRIKLEKKLAHMSRPRGERRSSEGSFVTISSASK